jgi:nucleotidyltransferase substrate binding protein (TIGR01987 family)
MSAAKTDKLKVKFTNLERAVAAVTLSATTPIQEPRDVSGIIKDFELAYELSWKALKAVLREMGEQTGPPKDVLSKAFKDGYLDLEEVWLAMIEDRNLSVHVYDEKVAMEIVERIKTQYLAVFRTLVDRLHGD